VAPRICYVVNAVSETSVPVTITTAVTDHTEYAVGILAWFDAEPFAGDDRVGVMCLDAPRGSFGLDTATVTGARDYLQGTTLSRPTTITQVRLQNS